MEAVAQLESKSHEAQQRLGEPPPGLHSSSRQCVFVDRRRDPRARSARARPQLAGRRCRLRRPRRRRARSVGAERWLRVTRRRSGAQRRPAALAGARPRKCAPHPTLQACALSRAFPLPQQTRRNGSLWAQASWRCSRVGTLGRRLREEGRKQCQFRGAEGAGARAAGRDGARTRYAAGPAAAAPSTVVLLPDVVSQSRSIDGWSSNSAADVLCSWSGSHEEWRREIGLRWTEIHRDAARTLRWR